MGIYPHSPGMQEAEVQPLNPNTKDSVLSGFREFGLHLSASEFRVQAPQWKSAFNAHGTFGRKDSPSMLLVDQVRQLSKLQDEVGAIHSTRCFGLTSMHLNQKSWTQNAPSFLPMLHPVTPNPKATNCGEGNESCQQYGLFVETCPGTVGAYHERSSV